MKDWGDKSAKFYFKTTNNVNMFANNNLIKYFTLKYLVTKQTKHCFYRT